MPITTVEGGDKKMTFIMIVGAVISGVALVGIVVVSARSLLRGSP